MAAVRLQPMPEGWEFLRSMAVAPESRAQGIGTAFLELLRAQLHVPTYCFPFDHLGDFYQRGGFVQATAADLPGFAREAFERYQQQGRKIIAMTYN